jgi:beta-phosphoglucomutase-like phosphatase (HAD superfamily)
MPTSCCFHSTPSHTRLHPALVGAVKPQAAIYEDAIKHAHCEPEECFYTDDIAAYVEAARKLGIDAEQFESWEQLRGQLRVRGVEIS